MKLWLPSREILRPAPVVPVAAMGMSGHVGVTLRRYKSGTIYKQWRCKNALMNAYLDMFAGTLNENTNGSFNVSAAGCFIGCGTGTAAPGFTDTTLAAEITPSSTNRSATDSTAQSGNGYVAGSPDYTYYNVVRDFTTSQANGTIGEMGLFTAASAGLCYAKCNPKDNTGTPTTISKTSSLTMEVIWQLRMQPLQTDVADSIAINGVTYTLTYRAANLNVTSNGSGVAMNVGLFQPTSGASAPLWAQTALVARTAAPAAGTVAPTFAFGTYATGQFFRDYQAKWTAAPTACVVLGPTISTSPSCTLQVGFSPSLAAGQTASFRISWARV
jgi:hypothetical protein